MNLKTIFYLLFIIGLTSCQSKFSNENDLKKEKLNGKVKSMTDNTYTANEKFGVIELGSKLVNFSNKENRYTEFNRFGFKTKEINTTLLGHKILYNYNKDNKIVDEKIMEELSEIPYELTSKSYDKEGRLIEDNTFDTSDQKRKLLQKRKFKYDNFDNLIEVNSYDENGKLDFKEKSKYNKEGFIIENQMYSENGTLDYIQKFYYDHNNNRIKYTSKGFNTATGNNQTIKSKFNDRNLEIQCENNYEATAIGRKESKVETYSYEYDDKGNWIKKIIFIANIPNTIVVRQIEYY